MKQRGYNCGSGQRPFFSTPEIQWINVDSQEKWNPDIVCDASELPSANESVDYVVLHHVLEHFGCGEAVDLVKEAHRVLKPKGSLIVCVPDMATLNHGWFTDKISTQIYMTCVYGAYMGSEEDRHRWGYTVGSLLEFLTKCADWGNQTHFDWRKIPGADIARDWWIAGVECVK